MSSVIACLMLASASPAQDQAPRTKIGALDLESLRVGRVTTLFMPDDRDRAMQLAELSQAAAAFYERELGVSFDLGLAVLGPKEWFSPHGAGLPYGIPWSSVAERLMVVPASLNEGALINGPSARGDRQRVDFVTLHELGHVIAKPYLHPASAHEEFPIQWFEELVATYIAYAFVFSFDQDWAESARNDQITRVESYTPRKRSLDWSFMGALPPEELAPTYAWYQYMLNLRVADVYAKHGIGFLRNLQASLPFRTMDTWTTESLLRDLERIAPGFQPWADDLSNHRRVESRSQTIMEALSEFRGLDEEQARAFAAAWLPAWSGNRPHDLIAFYTDDAYYSDPGMPAGLRGRDALLEYFIRLLAHNPNWRWTHRGSVPMRDGFLNEWHASMPVGERSVEIDGVCTVQFRDGLIYRNQVYFDRATLLQAIEGLKQESPAG